MDYKKIGPTFSQELAEAGLIGLPFSWGENGLFEYGEGLTSAQIKKIQAVYGAHNPEKEITTA